MVYSLEVSSMAARAGSATVFTDGSANSATSSRRNRRKRAKKALYLQDGNRQIELPSGQVHPKTKEARRFETLNQNVLEVLNNASTTASVTFNPGEEENCPLASSTSFNVTNDTQQVNLSKVAEITDTFKYLHSRELCFHPKTDFLFRINAECEDKVDASLRDEAIFNLRFLHKFNNLSYKSFSDAVNISDRFIVRVKVKPKYMACVATASYFIATKLNEDQKDQPTSDQLVLMARCGGTSNDLERMENIIRNKLSEQPTSNGGGIESSVTPLSFLTALKPLFDSESGYQCAVGELETVLCSVCVYRFTPAQIALALAAKFFPSKHSSIISELTVLCELTEADLDKCQDELNSILAKVPNRSPSPRTLSWNLSRRTLTSLQKPSAAAFGSILDPIHEDLSEDEWEVSRYFD